MFSNIFFFPFWMITSFIVACTQSRPLPPLSPLTCSMGGRRAESWTQSERVMLLFFFDFSSFSTNYLPPFSHFSLPAAVLQHIFPLSQICCNRGTISITHWFSSGQWRVPFGASWNQILSGMGQFLGSSHRGHPCRYPLPKPFHVDPVHS